MLDAHLLDPLYAPGPMPSLPAELASRVRPSARSKDVPTLLVALSLMVLLLAHVGGRTRTELLRSVVLLLAHRFPKVRKAAADLLYVHLITYGDFGELEPIADEEPPAAPADPSAQPPAAEPVEPAEPPMEAGDERLAVLMGVLTETAWLGALDASARPARARLLAVLGLPPPKVMGGGAAKVTKEKEETYAELVGEMGY